MKKVKPTAEEFLRSKGWAENSPIIGGALFKGIAELLEEYAKLQPYDPNIKRFPTEQEIDSMADLYPDGEIYVYAGVNLVKEWLKKRGLI